ncbi:hypothetical protein MNBD_NITROSPINAE04-1395 [hydrothermal vent metagenome]|uniref:Uncharacterized protein n=1 Tax=hydrothermal vent metagenome TaxID=652676 RepID=A0A3B1C5W0_9ZZZZ
MAKMAHIVLRKTARLVRKGETEKAERQLKQAIDSGLSDIRLKIRLAIADSDYKPLKEHLDQENKSGSGWFFVALDAFRRGAIDETRLCCNKALAISPGNLSVSALSAVADFVDGDKKPLFSMARDLPHVSIHAQALALSAIEKSIISHRLSDTGATDKDDRLGGPPGWVMDRLDDFAVFAYWLIWKVMNVIVNIADPKRRATASLTLNGDFFEGFGKKTRAARYYLRALRLDPDNQEALESMVIKSIENEAYEDAMTFLSRLVKSVSQNRAPDSPHLTKWKADILFKMKKFSEAEPLYEKATERFKLEYMLFYRLGLCRLRRGDDAGAVGYFEKSLSLIHHGLIARRLEFLGEIR